MPIKVTCPKCGGILHAPDDAGGKRGRCPTCGTVLNIPNEAPQVSAPAGRGSGDTAPSDNPFRGTGRTEPEAPAKIPGDAHRSSGGPGTFGFAEPESKKGRLPAPSFGPSDPRKVPEPANRSASIPTSEESVDVSAPGWRRVRRGLGWVRAGAFFLVLAFVAPSAVLIYEQYKGPLPLDGPGVLKVEKVSGAEEVRIGAAAIPALLGLFCVLIGRLGVAGAPASSYARGSAQFAAFATLLSLGGLVAAVVPIAMEVSRGVRPTELAPAADLYGIIQRFGLALMVGFWLCAELWFTVAIGRIGASLRERTVSSRSTRLLVFAGLLVVSGIVAWVAHTEYHAEVMKLWEANLQPTWDQLGDHKLAARAGLVILAALSAWIICLRLTGSTKRAIRSWLEYHHAD